MKHQFRRIIYVAPFLSIIEQNARVIRDALGVGDKVFVLEHHSLAEPSDEEEAGQTSESARLAENWDAPVVVTTNVQFFESLFSNRPGKCRKLHNIARSVVLLDECQALPPDLLATTCFNARPAGRGRVMQLGPLHGDAASAESTSGVA
jgi:CRISPR-associated endonuclease/helicase Cas3